MTIHEFGATVEVSKELRERGSRVGVKFGRTIRIPPRPAMRRTFDNNKHELGETGVKLLKSYLEGKTDIELTYESWGDLYRQMLRLGIVSKSLDLEENDPRIIKIKGSDTPLVDTGRLVNGSIVKVEDK